MITVSVARGLKDLQRSFDRFQRQQVPFATAQALTAIARRVQEAEKQNLVELFPTATPFTLNSIRVRAARKSNLTATVFVQDIAAAYLEPYLDGGTHSLGSKRGLLVPKNLPVNQYGNIPRNKLAQLKGRPDIFVGAIKTHSGATINGVWQRPIRSATIGIKRGKGKIAPNATGRLKLLVRFEDPLPVRQRLNYRERAEQVIREYFKAEFDAAMSRALATAKK